MVTKEVDIQIPKKKLNRNTFIFLIFIWSIVIYFLSLFLMIPAIVSLILFLQDKNLKHSFHKFFLYWSLSWQCVVILLLVIYDILELVSFFIDLFNESFGFIIGQLFFFIFISIILVLNLWYLKMLFIFKTLIEEKKNFKQDKKKNLRGQKKDVKIKINHKKKFKEQKQAKKKNLKPKKKEIAKKKKWGKYKNKEIHA